MVSSCYVGKILKINLTNGQYFLGRVISQNGDLITILDKVGKEVLLNLNSIMSLEVKE